jgi:hypothetical protein
MAAAFRSYNSAMSKLILFFHTLIFSALVVVCILSPFIAMHYPQAFNEYSLWVFGGIGVLILVTWYFYAGQCPLTVWENAFRKSAGKKPYTDPCIDHYMKEWFGLDAPSRFSDIVPIAVLVIPIVTRFFV